MLGVVTDDKLEIPPLQQYFFCVENASCHILLVGDVSPDTKKYKYILRCVVSCEFKKLAD